MSSTAGRDIHWEKANAPRVTRRQVFIAAAVYLVWLAFLGVLAARQWLSPLG